MKIDPLVKCVCVRVHMKQKNSVQFMCTSEYICSPSKASTWNPVEQLHKENKKQSRKERETNLPWSKEAKSSNRIWIVPEASSYFVSIEKHYRFCTAICHSGGDERSDCKTNENKCKMVKRLSNSTRHNK